MAISVLYHIDLKFSNVKFGMRVWSGCVHTPGARFRRVLRYDHDMPARTPNLRSKSVRLNAPIVC